MTTGTPSGNFDLDRALVNSRQSLILLRSQVESGLVDRNDMVNRIQKLGDLLDTIMADRRQHVDASRLTKLYEVSRAIGSSLDLQDVLNSVMDSIIALTDAERGFLMLLNDDGVLEVRTARNFDQETLDSGEFAVSKTITRQVFERGEAVVTTNAAEDPRYAGQASIVAHQLRSIMATPLRARGAIIGVVYVDNRIRTGLFRDSDLELLAAFAGQAAVAIDNARLFGETDEKLAQRMDEIKTLQWIDRQFAETLDPQKAMAVAVEWALRMSRAQSASLAMLPSDDSPDLNIMAHAGEETEATGMGKKISRNLPLVAQVLASRQPVAQELSHTGYGVQSVFCVPVNRENKTIGMIVVSADRENAFNSEAQALIIRMADRAAIAIENGRLYNELQMANQKKSEFVGTVAHELKVPMTSIRGYADLVSQFGQLDDRSQGFLERIRGSVARMQTLVEDLSDISRIESGNLRVNITEVDLREVIETAKAGTMGQIEERGHRYQEAIPQELPKVQADPARTIQILVNLLSNAYKYTPNGGLITVSAERQNGRVYVSVQDTGVGLSSAELQKLGTKFWRSDNEHTLKQSGTGLGFSITRQLLELMGGTLEIQSEVGKGSIFTIGLKVLG